MYDVQQTLFDAHKDPSLITFALQKVSEMLTSETAFLIALDGTTVQETFSFVPQDEKWQRSFAENKMESMEMYL